MFILHKWTVFVFLYVEAGGMIRSIFRPPSIIHPSLRPSVHPSLALGGKLMNTTSETSASVSINMQRTAAGWRRE